jgi:hypothetical protein
MSETPASIRKTLREAVATLLNGFPGLGTVQTGHHELPGALDDLPLTRVRTPSTTPEAFSSDDTDLHITLEVAHYAAVPPGSADSIDDLLDAASGTIYTALYQDGAQSLSGLVYHILPGPQLQTIDDESEVLLGVGLDTYTLICPFPKSTPPDPEQE